MTATPKKIRGDGSLPVRSLMHAASLSKTPQRRHVAFNLRLGQCIAIILTGSRSFPMVSLIGSIRFVAAILIGTSVYTGRLTVMSEPLPILVENALQIAWDYLERSGELGEPHEASVLLLKFISEMVRKGERRRLMLTNKAISEYQRHMAERLVA
jgi:hypothetical protein